MPAKYLQFPQEFNQLFAFLATSCTLSVLLRPHSLELSKLVSAVQITYASEKALRVVFIPIYSSARSADPVSTNRTIN